MTVFFMLVIVPVLKVVCYGAELHSTVVVSSPFGKIKGRVVLDTKDESYVHFTNIPYAKPPMGDLRFAKPRPHPRIDGIFDATGNEEVKCVHSELMLMGHEQGSEDCLVLNIFAKNVNPVTKLKKVMVFIHGGGFILGWSSSYSVGSFVSNHDVIGVTINYRLGVLGFLSTGNEASPGNYGLWDQALALQWVKDNIKAFGGDPDDVTLSGESAGSASVAYHALSPVSKGLFAKACLLSGTATSVFAQATDVQKHTVEMAKHAKCWDGEVPDKIDLKQSQLIITCLREVDVSAFTTYMFYDLSETRFAPSVDGDFIPTKPSLLMQDEPYLESIGFFDRPYLVSIVNNEHAIVKGFYDNTINGILDDAKLTEEEKKDAIAQYGTSVKDSFLNVVLGTDASNAELIEYVQRFYNRRNVEHDIVTDMVTDLSFLIPSYEFLNAASKQSRSERWFLFFDYFPDFMKGAFKGTVHAADLLFWHDITIEEIGALIEISMAGEMDGRDLRLKSMYSSLLVEFMKTGNPNGALTEHLPTPWPQYHPDASHYLNFDLQPTVRSHLEREKRDMWLKSVPLWRKKAHQHTEL